MVTVVLVSTLFVILAAVALETEAIGTEVLDHIELRLSEGVEPDWIPVGTFTELNASVLGTNGTDMTNVSDLAWEISNELVSWMPRAPNVIDLFPEWYGDLVVTVIATWEGQTISTSVHLKIVRTVVDARLEMDPLTEVVCYGDQVYFNITLLDWRDEAITDGVGLSWQVGTGYLVHTDDPARVGWTIEAMGHHSITVLYNLGPMQGAATYSLEVHRKLVSVELFPPPTRIELGSEHNVTVKVLDHDMVDVTDLCEVSIAVTDGCQTALRWSWDPSTGSLDILAHRPGTVTYDVVADLDGSTVRGTYVTFVNGTLDEPVIEYSDPPSDLLGALVITGLMFAVMFIIIGVPLLVQRIRDRDKADGEILDDDPD
jgi:hypothetical protein